ncbi:FxsA family protein [Nocardioides sp. Leaf285]|uniref:FxsA family protein n=1 Tax=Nocardioides sp. Leaf285 TaxID=1736322 RepID=UPI0009E896A6|nr:FxsA family protein [Nocardioides sp. Leaf285]
MSQPDDAPRPGRRPGSPAAGRRRPWALLLVAAFVVVPIVEIYVLIQVGQVIGVGWTVLLLVLDSILGGWLIRREGARAWRAMRTTLEAGRMPARELADGGLVVLGGTLMLSPGFVTDVFGILLILPITRPLFRGVLTTLVSRRLVGGVAGGGPAGPGGFPGAPRPDARRPGPGPQGPVVRGEVVDDE